MRAMVLTGSGPGEPRPARAARRARARAGRRGGAGARCSRARCAARTCTWSRASCRTRSPLVPGHQIVGTVERVGEGVHGFAVGDRVGVPWLGRGRRRLRVLPGAAWRTSASARRSRATRSTAATPSRRWRARTSCCRCPRLSGPAGGAAAVRGPDRLPRLRIADARGSTAPPRLGLFGFGASAQIVAQVARHLGQEVYVVHARASGPAARARARRRMGGRRERAAAGGARRAIIFAPAGPLVPLALRAVRKGGTVVCAGHPHERRSRSSRTSCCGASACCAPSRT